MLNIDKRDIIKNSTLINTGGDLYIDFITIMEKMSGINDYISIYDLMELLQIKPYAPVSKRKLYSNYDSGIVVGAGSGHDCIDLIDDKNWQLFDLQDNRMINNAIGYMNNDILFNKTGTSDGDTITNVSKKYNCGTKTLKMITIDSISNEDIKLISADVEGSAMDVLSGANQTLINYKPDLLISIYHNSSEYLMVIPLLYDLGYEINCIKTSNLSSHQPHLELSIFCTWGH